MGRDGVGHCTEDCPSHDGKRCKVLGLRAGGICEPWAVALVADRAALALALNRAASVFMARGPEAEYRKAGAALSKHAPSPEEHAAYRAAHGCGP